MTIQGWYTYRQEWLLPNGTSVACFKVDAPLKIKYVDLDPTLWFLDTISDKLHNLTSFIWEPEEGA